MLFDDRAKEVLWKAIWQVADFSGVEVLSYCVMSNHFHVLVRVTDGEALAVDDGELLRRYGVLYPNPTEYQQVHREVFEHLLREGGEDGEQLRCRMLVRMHDISQYMKTLKQRYTMWYNRTHDRVGTLCERTLQERAGGGGSGGFADSSWLYRPESGASGDCGRPEGLPVEQLWGSGSRIGSSAIRVDRGSGRQVFEEAEEERKDE
jgi:hypothetical protein